MIKKHYPPLMKPKNKSAIPYHGIWNALKNKQNIAIEERLQKLKAKYQALLERHKKAHAVLHTQLEKRQHEESHIRQQRFKTRLLGLFERMTGKHKKIRGQNELEAKRDEQQKDKLVFTQLQQQQVLLKRIERLNTFRNRRAQLLDKNIQQYKYMRQSLYKRFNQQSKPSRQHPRRRPSYER